MRVIREVKIGERAVSVKELTLGEIRGWLRESSSPAGDVVDATLFEDFDAQDLCVMTSLKGAELDALTPTECRELAAACREVNADFFAMRQRVVAMGRQLLSAASNPLSQG